MWRAYAQLVRLRTPTCIEDIFVWDLSSSTDDLYKNNITLFSPKIGKYTHITLNDVTPN